MKKILMFIALAGLCGASSASTDFTYSAATDGSYYCANWCSGFITSDPAHRVQYVSVAYAGQGLYRLVVTVDSQAYSGYTAAPGQLSQLTEYNVVGGIGSYGSSTILASAQYTTKTTCVRSGRGQHCTTFYYPFAGSVSLL